MSNKGDLEHLKKHARAKIEWFSFLIDQEKPSYILSLSNKELNALLRLIILGEAVCLKRLENISSTQKK